MTACIKCTVGTYNTGVGMQSVTACIRCAAGKYSAYSSQTKSAACLACVAGKYSSGNGMTSCTICPLLTYSTAIGSTTSSNCASCIAAGKSSGFLRSSCAPCAAGTFCIDGYRYDCGFGQYSTGTGMSIGCQKCSGGKYQNTRTTATDESSCTSCPQGTFSTALGEGYIGFTSCAACKNGTFTRSVGSTTCTVCPSANGTGCL